MRTSINPPADKWLNLVCRPDFDDAKIEGRVMEILAQVRKEGDSAIRKLSLAIDGYAPDSLIVSEEELLEASKMVSEELKNAIDVAINNISKFHSAQKFTEISVETVPGVVCKQRAVPIQKVGLYIPGGTAPLFSTVLMLAIPAKIAGCKEIVICTPCNKEGKVNPAVLYAAKCCGVDKVCKIGGAQAVAAMAYGTQTVTKVDKIFGPGNRYVSKAKQKVLAEGIAIDMLAGPSEVLVIADGKANPAYVASDLLSQAEHGADSQVCLLCTDACIADKVAKEVDIQLGQLARQEIALKALQNSNIIVFDCEDDIVSFTNLYAPEHLIINTEQPWAIADKITAAGSVFIGQYSPESAGDYASGTNHTLPTSGTAVAYSGVNLDSFIKKITYQELTKEGLAVIGGSIMEMAKNEGLDAHLNAVRIRL